jgi:hypothetical protein
MSTDTTSPHRLAICLFNDGHEASLERRKLYEVVPDPDADTDGDVRVIDESGEDYLYPSEWFEPVDLPEDTRIRVLAS